MNAMTTAMREAGVKTPSVMYRIWNWLKDHPEKTAEDITKALGMNYSVQTQLLDMTRRGMLTVYKDKSRKTGIGGIEYMVQRYSVVNKGKYELLPKPKKHVPIAKERKFNLQISKSLANPPKLSDVLGTSVSDTPKVELTEAEKFAAFLEFKALTKEMK